MKADGIIFVDAGEFIGLIRWILAIILVFITVYLLLKKDKDGKKNKAGLIALLISIIAVPLLILTIRYIPVEEPKNTPVVPEKHEKKEDEPDVEPIPDIPEEDQDNANDMPNEDSSSRNSSRRSSRRSNSSTPSEAPKPSPKPDTNPDVDPEPEPDPEAKTVSYKVFHKLMDLNGSDYTLADTFNGEGKSGSPITPSVNSYNGFTAPRTQTKTLPDDDSLEITYLYTRNKYHLKLNNSDRIETTTPEDDYYFETPITLKAKELAGYSFTKWSDGNTSNPYSFTLGAAKTVGPEYAANTYQVIFNKNNASATGQMAAQTMTYDQNANLSANAFSLENYIFKGWATSSTATEVQYNDKQQVKNLSTGSDFNLYAIWQKDISQATVNPRSFSLTRGDTAQLEITNADDVEDYTLSSSNESVVTVDANGNVAATGAGTAKIIITGTKSGKTKEIDVAVALPKYTVSFETHGGSSVAPIENIEEGSTISTIPQTNRSSYVFKGWWTAEEGGEQLTTSTPITGNAIYHAHWVKDVSHAIFSHEDIVLEAGETLNFTITNSSELELHTVEIENSNIAAIEGNTITALTAGTTRIIVTGIDSHATKTTTITVTEHVVIRFDAKGGVDIDPIRVEKGSKLSEIPVTTRAGYTFDGWWTAEDGGEQLTTDTVINADVLYYAHWTEDGPSIVCKVAEELHTEKCQNGGCSQHAGMSSGDTITFGTIPTSESPMLGDAYDCYVYDDSKVDSRTVRFYVIDAGENDTDDVRLVAYTNYGANHQPSRSASEAYGTSLSYLPTDEEWKNPLLKQNPDGNRISFPLYNDVITHCSTLTDCVFLLENTAFSEKKDHTIAGEPRSGVWLTSTIESGQTKYHRVQAESLSIMGVGETSKNGARPTIQVARENIEKVQPVMRTINFSTLGGEAVEPISIENNKKIGTLPTTRKPGFVFKGWSLVEGDTTAITEDYIVTGDTILYAIWQEKDGVARIGEDDYYETLQAAITAATGSTRVKVELLKDTTETITINSGQIIELDLGGHTVNYGNSNTIKNNSGDIIIKNGNIVGSYNKGGAIDCNGGRMVISGATIESASVRQALYNKGGTVYIQDGAILKTTYINSERDTLQVLENGTTYVLDATITNASTHNTGTAAVKVENGTLILGAKDGIVDVTTPVLQGNKFAIAVVNTSGKVYFYDGILKGNQHPIGTSDSSSDTNYGRITAIEDDTALTPGAEGSLKTLTLAPTVPKYRISFDANGGTVDVTGRTINQGSEIGSLPTPVYTKHTFLGWFTEKTGGRQISATEVPDGNLTYYAHWEAHSSDEIVSFNIQSDAVNNYFANVSSWNTSEDAFLKALKKNFDDHECKINAKTDITTNPSWPSEYMYNETFENYCDRPQAYNTGVATDIEVYLSNEDRQKGKKADYLKISNGTINNMIPGTIYRWESTDDPDVYGYVRATGERRFIELPNTRNVRDLGGIATTTGKKIKYGRLMRGEWLQNASDVAELRKLGMDKEYDLRDTDISGVHFSNNEADYKYPVVHYNFNYGTSGYATTRNALVSLIHDIVDNHKNVYFHCTHGSDRTGTIAWLLESLLGVSDEDMHRDYELTSISGRPDRTRYYSHKNTVTEKYTFMMDWMLNYPNRAYDWFMAGSTDQTADENLINALRAELLEN